MTTKNILFFIFILIIVFLYSCKTNDILQVKNTNYTKFIESDTTVLVFISPYCPICQKYTHRINELGKEYIDKGLDIVGVVPTASFSEKEIKVFQRKYDVDYSIIHDSNNLLVKALTASVTPECMFMVDGKILYRGAIDDWFYAPGKSSNKTINKYLKNALVEFYNDKTITVKETEPVGCFIEN